MKQLLTEKEVAAEWGIPAPTLARRRWAGLPPRYVKLGGRVYYRRPDLEEWIAGNTREPAPGENGKFPQSDSFAGE